MLPPACPPSHTAAPALLLTSADDLQAQDWLAAAASLARADSQPSYPNFPGESSVPGGPAVPSLGSSPARPPSLPMPLAPALLPPALGLQQLHEQHWLAMMGSLQQAHHAQHAQQQRSTSGKGEGGGGGVGNGSGPSGKPPLGADAPMSAVHRRLQQLAEEAGAAAAAAAGGTGTSSSKGKAAGGGADLDTAQELDGFGRYRQGSLHSLQVGSEVRVGLGWCLPAVDVCSLEAPCAASVLLGTVQTQAPSLHIKWFSASPGPASAGGGLWPGADPHHLGPRRPTTGR